MKKFTNILGLTIVSLIVFTTFNTKAQTPNIELIQPTEAGIEWVVGGTYLISWVDNFQSTTDILLSSNGGATYSTTLATGVSGSTWSWNTTGLSVSNNYKIKVQSTSAPSSYFDFSNNKFALVDGTSGSITLNQPTGGEYLTQGVAYLISWNDNISAPVKIELLENNVHKSVISASTTGTTLNWTVPTAGITLNSKIYKIKISSTVSGSSTQPAISNKFTISASSGTTIEVLQPTHGNKWSIGTTHLISWNDDLTEDVKIELWDKSSGSWTLVPQWKSGFPTNAVSGSTYNWSIPSSVDVGNKYKIKIISSSDDNLYDFSSQFKIKSSAGTFITVLQPANNDKWAKNTTHLISWNDDFTEGVKLELWEKLGGSWSKVPQWKSGLPSASISGSTYNWNIPNSVDAGTKYKIKALSSLDSDINDLSSRFSITTSSGTFISVLQPNGGEKWAEGTTHLISWNDDLPEDVKLELWSRATGSWEKVPAWKSGLPNTAIGGSTYNWDIPQSVDVGTKFKIKAISSLDSDISDLSNSRFRISASAGTYITLEQPNGGENWAESTTHLISWIDDLPESVKLELWDRSSGSWQLVPSWKSGLPNTAIVGSTYSWSIPSSVDIGTKYKIKAISSLDDAIYDFSNSRFSITASNGTFVEVLNPNGGESWARGNSYLISWNDDMTEDVNIKLVKGGVESVIANNVSGSSYNWDIPSGIDLGSNYKVKVESSLNSNLYDRSNSNFSIVASLGTYITILQPNGGESWVLGTTNLISWIDDFPEPVDIKLKKGGVYTDIASNVEGSTYSWEIPTSLTPGSNYKVKIFSTLDGSIKDYSDSNFSLVVSSMSACAYPNPANQSITLKLKDAVNNSSKVTIYNRFNSVVYSTNANFKSNGEITISTANLPNGIYFISITNQNSSISKKIIIQH